MIAIKKNKGLRRELNDTNTVNPKWLTLNENDYCPASHYYIDSVCKGLGLWCLLPLSTILQLYRGDQFLLVKETGVPGENHIPAVSHCQTLSHNAISKTSPPEVDANSQLYR